MMMMMMDDCRCPYVNCALDCRCNIPLVGLGNVKCIYKLVPLSLHVTVMFQLSVNWETMQRWRACRHSCAPLHFSYGPNLKVISISEQFFVLAHIKCQDLNTLTCIFMSFINILSVKSVLHHLAFSWLLSRNPWKFLRRAVLVSVRISEANARQVRLTQPVSTSNVTYANLSRMSAVQETAKDSFVWWYCSALVTFCF